MDELNRIKVVWADKRRTNKWLAGDWGKVPRQSPNGVQILGIANFREPLIENKA